jgi:hypothetical protein
LVRQVEAGGAGDDLGVVDDREPERRVGVDGGDERLEQLDGAGLVAVSATARSTSSSTG